jgi:hypothetical protein
MTISNNTKRIAIHILRVASYIIFPIGCFVFGIFLLSASQGLLDSNIGDVLFYILILGLFFGPPAVILLVHPVPKNLTTIMPLGASQVAVLGTKEHWPQHVAIIVVLAVVGFVPFLYIAMFIVYGLGAM